MPLLMIRPGNFHQLRSCLGGNCRTKFFQYHTGVIHGKLVGGTRSSLQPSAAKVDGWFRKTNSGIPSNINQKICNRTFGSGKGLSKADPRDPAPIHCFQGNVCGSMANERHATLLVFDTETTGVSRQNDRIIEIAFRDLIGGKNSTFQTIINPEKVVTNADIHGISSSMVNRPDVPRFKDLIPILLQFVKSRQMDDKPVLLFAHNGRSFDVPMIMREFQRCSMEIPDDWIFVDTLPIARLLLNPDGSKRASSRLDVMREHYGIELEGPAHRAMQDVMTLSYVLQRLTFDLKLTVPDLILRGFRASDLTKNMR